MKTGTWVYVSGPMTGFPDHNYPAFREAANRLRGMGMLVMDPSANHDGATHLPRTAYMRLDLQHVLLAQAVVVLPGWERSAGARLEAAIAVELGLGIYTLDLTPVVVSIGTRTPVHTGATG